MGGRKVMAALGVAVAVSAIAGCGGSSSTTSGTTGGSAGTSTAAPAKADVAAARAAVAQYSGKPTAFPVDEPLKQRPEGKTFAYLQCSTPACALFTGLLEPTQKLLGYQLKVVKAGPSATELQNAMSSIVAMKPDGVLLPASDPNQYLPQLKELQEAKIPVVANGIVDGDEYGLQATFLGNDTDELAGRLMADWAIAKSGGGELVFYSVPELSFSALMRDAFDGEVKQLCSSCTVRHVDIPISAIGSTAPGLVTSDLQSHPDTKVAAFASAEAATGLPAALKTAGIDVRTIGFGPSPATLQYIKNGEFDAGVAVDGPSMLWGQVDALARTVAGEPLTKGEQAGLPPLQILEQKDITFDPTQGFVGYPDFAQRYAKLWGAAPAS